MRVVIFAGGVSIPSQLTKKVLARADFLIAADSGAHSAIALGTMPDMVIGDLDSIKSSVLQQLKKHGVVIKQFAKDKNETDTELAVLHAEKVGATEITILGGSDGNRFDHVLANILLAAISRIPLRFVNGNQITWVEKGPVSRVISGTKGNLLSLLPICGNVKGMMLSGLQYPLQNETLYFGKPRGISNVFTRRKAVVAFTKGTLLLIHTVI